MSRPAPLVPPGTHALAGPLSLEPLEDVAAWQAAVDRIEHATFCHHTGWREVMTDALGHECLYRVARGSDGAVRGVLPLVRMRSRILGQHLVSMPFLNYGGPVGSPAARRLLAAWALAEAARLRADSLELRLRAAGEPLPGYAPGRPKVTVLLDLPPAAESLWNAFPSKLRSQIRRPLREGMQLVIGPGELGAFHDVFSRNMRDLGTPVLARGFFERLLRVFPDEVVFAAVHHRGVPVAAGCGFLWRGEFELTWASSLREANRLAPNMLLYWGLMEWAIGRGARLFNFGRCTPGGGTHRFKLQWGGRDLELPWATGAGRGTPGGDGRTARLATRAWRRLPLPVANRLGPFLSRRIPTF